MTDSTTTYDISILIELLERQVALFDQLGELSAQQTKLVEASDAEALLGVLAQRQKHIDELTGVNEAMEPYRTAWQVVWGAMDVAQQQRVGPLVKRAQGVLESIMLQDERDQKQMLSVQDQLRSQMGQIHKAGAAVQAYGAAYTARDPGRYTNRQG